MPKISLVQAQQVPVGTARVVLQGNRELAVFNVEGTFYVVDNTCPHAGGPLGDGELSGCVVTCPWHGWQFDVSSGRSVAGVGRLVCHGCSVEEGWVKVDLPA